MPIDFFVDKNRYTYADRSADNGWDATIRGLVDPTGRRVVDVGCGGGIYSQAWRALGVKSVVGVDFSAQMVAAARERAAGRDAISFTQGDATDTGLPALSADIVFERALIHHLKTYDACFAEASRILVPGGLLLLQDRTPDDVAIAGAPDHLRGYFFERFPRLLAIETGRRPTRAAVEHALKEAGFENVETHTLWEVRKNYTDFDELEHDLAARTGRSILHELNDAELDDLIGYIREKIPAGPIVEKDCWTLWLAAKPR